MYRVANDDLDRYLLYLGIDSEPEFVGDPWESFTALPHTSGPIYSGTPSGAHSYHLVLRKQNAFGVISRNIESFIVNVPAGGGVDPIRPSGPDMVAMISDGAAPRISARYLYGRDGDNSATQWLIYLTNDGSEPDPDSDEPIVSSMVQADGVADLDYTGDVLLGGAIVKALVRTRRVDAGPVNVDSDNATILTIAISDTEPTEPDSGALLGDRYEVLV